MWLGTAALCKEAKAELMWQYEKHVAGNSCFVESRLTWLNDAVGET